MKVSIDLRGSSNKWPARSARHFVRDVNNKFRSNGRRLLASISKQRWVEINRTETLREWESLNLTDDELDIIADIDNEKILGEYVLCCTHRVGEHEEAKEVCWGCYYSEQQPEEVVEKMGRKKYAKYSKALRHGKHKLERAA